MRSTQLERQKSLYEHRDRSKVIEYWNNPDATRECITEDGWFRTGDVAPVDEEGFTYIQDRIKDMIISGGGKAYPAEIETVILSHPQVSEIAVIGQASEKWGEFAVVVKNWTIIGSGCAEIL